MSLIYTSHLLGKKSWNVYNVENIARVKRDEAQAKAREEEDERRMQEVDAERRIQLLRGERPSTPPLPKLSNIHSETSRSENNPTDDAGRSRKRRRLVGEDDTDRDIRLAREDAARNDAKREEMIVASRRNQRNAQAPLLDSAGHINLFPAEGTNKTVEKNRDAEAEAEKNRRSYEDQYTMRFSNAAGFKQTAGGQPWYSSSAQTVAAPNSLREKNVWGDEDPMRRDREIARMNTNDPLAAMKRGVRQLKATQQERKRWNEAKREELEALKAGEQRHSSHHRRRRSGSVDSLDGFKLDAPTPRDREKDHNGSRRHRHSDYHRDRSRDRDRDHSTRRSRHSTERPRRHHTDKALENSKLSRKSDSGVVYQRR